MRFKFHFILLQSLLLFSHLSLAQSRKFISQFSHFQSYYNPALSGYEGATVRGFVRNQWVGMDGAPKTYHLSAELDFAQFGPFPEPALMGKNALSFNFLHDQYGPYQENEMILAYASRIRLSNSTNLRLGAGLNYNNVQLDGNVLTAEMVNDPILSPFQSRFAYMRILDFNLGMALTHYNYFISYSMHNVNQGNFYRGEAFMDRKSPVSIFMAGYREAVSPSLALSANIMYRNQADLPNHLELNVKMLFSETFWFGAGHRVTYANNFQLGFVLPQFRIGYIYELPMNRSYLLPNVTHEFTLIFSLFKPGRLRGDERVMIW
ncbi:PorP/SprF family type IX secretion system membrane protein [Cecembia rubra]|uniref:PorP/SprF family type IX secretion system membrane protein n=1 Tax=Cecembia rubra TaxID=1485585 RepID=UPI002714EEDA|nr:PorP/SprF family type IX secretion system membrane protein [Cecembia rubra]